MLFNVRSEEGGGCGLKAQGSGISVQYVRVRVKGSCFIFEGLPLRTFVGPRYYSQRSHRLLSPAFCGLPMTRLPLKTRQRWRTLIAFGVLGVCSRIGDTTTEIPSARSSNPRKLQHICTMRFYIGGCSLLERKGQVLLNPTVVWVTMA